MYKLSEVWGSVATQLSVVSGVILQSECLNVAMRNVGGAAQSRRCKRTHIDQCRRPQVCWYADQEQESYAAGN